MKRWIQATVVFALLLVAHPGRADMTSDGLLQAAFECNVPTIQALLEAGVNPESVGRSIAYAASRNVVVLVPALHEAAGRGCLEGVRLLLEAGSDPNLRAEEWTGDTALYMAAYYGRTGVVKHLLTHGAVPVLVDEEGQVLCNAVEAAHASGNPAVIKSMEAATKDSALMAQAFHRDGHSYVGRILNEEFQVQVGVEVKNLPLGAINYIRFGQKGGQADLVMLRDSSRIEGRVITDPIMFEAITGFKSVFEGRQLMELHTETRIGQIEIKQGMPGSRPASADGHATD